MLNWPTPKTLTELRGFLGLVNYYRIFIKRCAVIARPLNHLLRKGRYRKWTGKQRMAFNILKRKLTQAPVLMFPNFTKEFQLYTDASKLGLGATLEQKDEQERGRPVAYASRALNKAEENYEVNFGITDLEGLAVYWAIRHFRKYLQGRHFKLITDHSALKYIYKHAIPEGRKGRWISDLQSYDFEVIHRPGRVHSNVDGLSRLREQWTTQLIPAYLNFYQQMINHQQNWRNTELKPDDIWLKVERYIEESPVNTQLLKKLYR